MRQLYYVISTIWLALAGCSSGNNLTNFEAVECKDKLYRIHDGGLFSDWFLPHTQGIDLDDYQRIDTSAYYVLNDSSIATRQYGIKFYRDTFLKSFGENRFEDIVAEISDTTSIDVLKGCYMVYKDGQYDDITYILMLTYTLEQGNGTYYLNTGYISTDTLVIDYEKKYGGGFNFYQGMRDVVTAVFNIRTYIIYAARKPETTDN